MLALVHDSDLGFPDSTEADRAKQGHCLESKGFFEHQCLRTEMDAGVQWHDCDDGSNDDEDDDDHLYDSDDAGHH